MKRVLLAVGVFFSLVNAHAQIRVGLENNSQWYVDDKKIKLDPVEAEKDRFRANSYLKVDYDYKNWSFGTQLESYAPNPILNYNPEFKNFDIGTIYARYNNVEKGLDVTAGHFYDQFGSGLLFRAWEDRQLGINNAMFGLNAKYSIGSWGEITVLGGKQRTIMGFDLSKSIVFGGDLNVDVGQVVNAENLDLSLGLSYLGRSLESDDLNKGLDNFTSGYSFRFDYRQGGFYLGSEYVLRDKDYYATAISINKNMKLDSNAWLVNLGYAQKGLSFDFNFRRMENMSFYSERQFTKNDYHQGVLNYLPALVKQYDYSLQNIYVYQAQTAVDLLGQKAGEIGGQFDFYYEFPKGSTLGGKYGTNLVINGSYWAGLKTEYDIVDKELSSEFLSFGQKNYRDLGFEVRKRWSSDWSSIFMYLDQYYNAVALEGKFEDVKAQIISAETTYQFLENKSIRLEAQHMWADKDKKNWLAGTLEFAYNANWAVFVNDMYNYGNDDKEKKIHYYNAGISYTKGTTRVSTSYGRQRGGLLCVGGVCRYVTEAAGLTVGITTSF
ncbi:hypothetical protein M2306_003098 [Myroides gitamensis]|uniref:DUF5723 domain-containing protein n=1 Tax=Myroides odoratus TaxID=256 RepID=A0A378U4E5_MYROD|nr:DUF6029 family protein [Myroides odoratus]MCS4239217.1 hypothetical protein [Myroides odoratus]MDH6602404.1 hypothetical protein [Myroides gitamensis]QQU03540.1 hypothetical protein I6I89_17335 [Myroides odoratus]STZ69192.1 Uncharacterised protein [Myroides odoratus]